MIHSRYNLYVSIAGLCPRISRDFRVTSGSMFISFFRLDSGHLRLKIDVRLSALRDRGPQGLFQVFD